MELNKIGDSIEGGIRVLIRSPLILIPAIYFGLLDVLLTVIKPSPTPWSILITVIPVILLSLFALFCWGMVVRMSYDAVNEKASLYKSANFVFRRYFTLLLASMVFGVIVFTPAIIGSSFPTLLLLADLKGLLPTYLSIHSLFGIPYALLMAYAIGFMFLIISLFLSIKLTFYIYTIMIDEAGVIGSLKESWSVTNGNWWGVFVICVIFWLLGGIPSIMDGLLPLKAVLVLRFALGLLVTPLFYSSLTIAYMELRK